MMRIFVIVQARMSSRRLPGKVLTKLAGKPLLQWVMKSVAASRKADGVMLATSQDATDDPVEKFAIANGWTCFRGPLENVAERFLHAAEFVEAEGIVRISGDSPLLDHQLIDRAIELFRSEEWDLVTNIKERTFPNGTSVELFSTSILRKAIGEMETLSDREHVTPWLYRSEGVRIRNFKHIPNLSGVRLTVDTPDDLVVMQRVMSALDRPHVDYRLEEVVELRERILKNLQSA